MSIYVDNYRFDICGMKMSHMAADTEAELDAMAVALSLSPSWKQITPGRPPHYDVCASKRLQAIRLGAIPVTPRELVSFYRFMRLPVSTLKPRIVVTLEITDPDTVSAYWDVADDLLYSDLCDGTLMRQARLVSRENTGD